MTFVIVPINFTIVLTEWDCFRLIYGEEVLKFREFYSSETQETEPVDCRRKYFAPPESLTFFGIGFKTPTVNCTCLVILCNINFVKTLIPL